MNKIISSSLVSLALVPALAGAGNFDGSQPLLCASTEVIECLPAEECLRVTPEAIDAPQFIRLDLTAKTLTTSKSAGAGKSTAIERYERVDGKLILQGAEDGVNDVRDGVGWTLSISEDTGKMVVTASGDDVGFVIFGACTTL